MTGPVRPPLSVSDGTTTVRPTNSIVFDAADGFTVTDNGASARIDFSGGGSATLTDTFIGFGSAANALTGSANFTFTEETGGNGPAVLLTGDKPVLKLQDDTDATTYRAEFLQSGASQYINMKDSTGTNNEMFRIAPSYIAMQRSMTANVGIGTVPATGVALHVKGTGTGDLVKLESTDAGSSSAPDLVLYRSSTSPANNDFIGRFDFRGKNAAASDVDYAIIATRVLDATSGTGRLVLYAGDGATPNLDHAGLMIQPTEVTVNEAGLNNMDFRVEGDTLASLLRTDSSQDNVGIGVAPPSGHTGVVPMLTVKGADDAIALLLVNEGTDSDHGPEMVMFRDSSSPAVNDLLGRIRFDGEDTGGNPHTYFRMTSQIKDPTDGNEDGNFFMTSRAGGSLYDVIKINGAQIEMNPNAAAEVDVLIKGDTTNLLFADAGDDSVGIGGFPDSNTARLQVTDDGTKSYTILLESTDADANQGPVLGLWRNSPSPADGDNVGEIDWRFENDAGSRHLAARIQCDLTDVTAGTEDTKLQFKILVNGTERNVLNLRESEVVVNEDSVDLNFRVESNSNTEMFRVDAGLDIVSVGAAPTGTATANGALQVPDGSISSYKFLTNVSGTSPQTLTNDDLQSKLFVHNSASAHQYNLPAGVRGMYLKFVSTDGNITIQPDASDTINGGVAGGSITRSVDNQIYECVCYDANKWIVSNP